MKKKFFLRTQITSLFFCSITWAFAQQPYMIRNIGYQSGNANPALITDFNGKAVFQADDNLEGPNNNIEPWMSDGSYYGTELLKNINPQTTGNTSSNPAGFIVFNNKLYFSAKTSSTGTIQLWVTDGTTSGTTVFGSGYSNPTGMTLINNELYFVAGGSLKNIYKTNGTTVTQLTTATLHYISGITKVGNSIIFAGDGTASNYELWILDNTSGGASLLKEINSNTSISSTPSGFTVLNNKAYFSAAGNGGGRELWVTDGTSVGTTLVKDINPGGTTSSNPSLFTVFNSKIYFIANDGTNGVELWVTDGTPGNTTMVSDIYAGSTGSNPAEITIFSNKLFFSADHATLGREIFTCTSLNAIGNLKDIVSGTGASNPTDLEIYNGKLYFSANDGTNGAELWSSAGTNLTTTMLANIVPGLGGSTPSNLKTCGQTLYFSATDGVNGRELWAYNSNTAPTLTLSASSDTVTCGTNTTLTVSGAATYHWSTGATTSSISVAPLNSTTYYVNGIAANGAVRTDSIRVTVKPVGGITLTSSAGTGICGGNTATTISATGIPGSSTYNWGYTYGGYFYPFGEMSLTYSNTPTGTTNYTLISTRPNGCVDTTRLLVNVYGLPSVTIAPANPITCSGTPVNIQANGSGNLTYAWSNGTTTALNSVSPTVPTTYTVVATDLNGCTKTASKTVNTNPLPDVLTITQDTGCAGSYLQLGLTSNPGTTITWYTDSISFSNNMGSGTTLTTQLLNASKTYYVDVYYTNTICRIPHRQPVTATILPSVTPVLAINASQSTICSGSTVTFSSTPTNGGGSPTYQWKLNGNAVSGQTASTYTTATLTNGDIISCQMTSNAVCPSPATVTSNSITIASSSTVVPAVNISAAQTTICSGTTVSFTATPTNGGTSPAYQWTLNGGAISGETNATYSSSVLNNGDVIACELTSSVGCASPSTATSNAVAITVIPSVIPSISITAPQTTTCPGGSITFSSTAANEGAQPIYQWQINGTDIPGENNTSYTASSLSNGDIISCELTSSASCATPASIISDSIIVTVSTSVIASVSVTTPQTNICSGTPVTFTAAPTNGGSSPAYQWYLNGNAISGETGTSYTSGTLNNTDAIICEMVSNANCLSSSSTVNSSPVTMIVNPLPDNTVTVSGNVITATEAGASYSWYDCNSQTLINGQNGQSYTAMASGSYAVIVSSNGCADTSVCNAITSTEMEQIATTGSTLSVYPNPAHQYTVIDNTSQKPVSIEITDIAGKIVYRQKNALAKSIVNTSSWYKGIYQVKIFSGETIRVSRLVVQ